MDVEKYIKDSYNEVIRRNPQELCFHQAVREVLESLESVLKEKPEYIEANILARILEPERMIMFRVPWQDDTGAIQVNRGFRVQYNSALGPFKGGLRFHPSVDLGIIKFLGFEQIFKNALTTLPLGGGKGGSDFDPKGKSDYEIMRFCQAFMSELQRHIGADLDVPAGDIGVGAREIGYLFGQYKKLRNEFTGVITGKRVHWGGSNFRPEATGYGSVYFAQEMLKSRDDTLYGKICVVSGSGNVAQYTTENLIDHGAKVTTLSDSGGTIHDPEGLDEEKLKFVMELKNNQYGRISEYAEEYPGVTYHPGKKPWVFPCDCAFPSATQNELTLEDAKELFGNGCHLISEGANMPTEPEAVQLALSSGVLFGPGKAANAGGVAVSGLEMSQNSMRLNWKREEVDSKLQQIMQDIHQQCLYAAKKYGVKDNLVAGANIAGFIKVADAMIDQGLV